MRYIRYILLFCTTHLCAIDYRLQIQALGNLNSNNKNSAMLRLLPELSHATTLKDFELDGLVSAKISASTDLNASFQEFWLRLAKNQSEISIGRQNIDFGASKILRPLQWFARPDISDPSSLPPATDTAVIRHYFANSDNIWFWVLPKTKSQDFAAGGRYQIHYNNHEFALSLHSKSLAVDGTLDLGVGLWFEGVIDQQALSIGTDYSWQDLYSLIEVMTSKHGSAIAWQNAYTVGLLDSINTILAYSQDFSAILSWQRTYDTILLSIAYIYQTTSHELRLWGQYDF